MNGINYRRILLFLLAPLALILMLWFFNLNLAPSNDISITQLATDINAGTVKEVTVSGDGSDLTILYKDDSVVTSRTSGSSSLEEILGAYGVDESSFGDGGTTIIYKQPSQLTSVFGIILAFLPVLLIIGFFYFMYRQSQEPTTRRALSAKARPGCSPVITQL